MNILNRKIQLVLLMRLKAIRMKITIKWLISLISLYLQILFKIFSRRLHSNCKASNHQVYSIKIMIFLVIINNKIMVISNILINNSIKAISKIKAIRFIQINLIISMGFSKIIKKHLVINIKADNSLVIQPINNKIDSKILK